MKTSSISYWLKQIRLPHACALCSIYHSGSDAVCMNCYQLLTPIGSACTYCAQPLPQGNFLVCGRCIQTPPYFDSAFAPFIFEEPLRTLLHEFKYHQSLYLLSFLAKLIIQHLPKEALATECLIPIPMHKLRLRQRGFNHSLELAKVISNHFNLPWNAFICQKSNHTLPQAGLNADLRKKNLRNSFQAQAIHYKHVTLIDDLITTGSTANELARILKSQGVERVDVWCCARVLDSAL